MTTRTPLYLALASLTGLLTACGGEGTEPAAPPNAVETYQVKTHPRFNPVVSDVPFNSDIIFAKAAVSDGTADLGNPTDPVRHAINQADGFSISGAFDVLIEGSVNPASVIANQTVFLVALDAAGKDALDLKNVVGVKGAAQFDAVVVSLDGGSNNAIRVRPLAPLDPKTKYLVVLTNDIKDASGQALTRSFVFNSLLDADYATAQGLAPLKPLLSAWLGIGANVLAAGSNGTLTPAAAQDKIVLTYAFTTSDPVTTLVASAAPRAALVAQLLQAGKSLDEAKDSVASLDSAGLLSTPQARAVGLSATTGVDFANFSSSLAAQVGKLYTGFIKLPYYLSAPTNTNISEYITKPWQPNLTLAGMLGVTLPADLDGSYNVTYRYPFVQQQSLQSVPLQVTLPSDTWVPGYAGAANCGQIYAETGYPTVIYVHGITSDRSSIVALGHTLASRCIATVAIDLPLHGVPANSEFVNALNVERSQLIPFATIYGANAPAERHFNVGGGAGTPAPMNFANPTAADGSGAQFINLGYLANTRDNNRQAIMDLLNLNASLASIDTLIDGFGGPGLNYTQPYVVGVSLGGILSTTFTAVNQSAILQDRAAGLTPNLNPIKGLVASVAGAQLTQVLVNSEKFAPVINGGLAASGVNAGTTNYERFLYATQTMVDAADPVSFAGIVKQLGVPTLLQQVNGDGVVPNSAAGAPLAGTQGLAQLLGAVELGVGTANLTDTHRAGYVKLTQGGHASLMRPENGAPMATAELQTQVVTFVLTGGKGVSIGSLGAALIETPAN